MASNFKLRLREIKREIKNDLGGNAKVMIGSAAAPTPFFQPNVSPPGTVYLGMYASLNINTLPLLIASNPGGEASIGGLNIWDGSLDNPGDFIISLTEPFSLTSSPELLTTPLILTTPNTGYEGILLIDRPSSGAVLSFTSFYPSSSAGNPSAITSSFPNVQWPTSGGADDVLLMATQFDWAYFVLKNGTVYKLQMDILLDGPSSTVTPEKISGLIGLGTATTFQVQNNYVFYTIGKKIYQYDLIKGGNPQEQGFPSTVSECVNLQLINFTIGSSTEQNNYIGQYAYLMMKLTDGTYQAYGMAIYSGKLNADLVPISQGVKQFIDMTVNQNTGVVFILGGVGEDTNTVYYLNPTLGLNINVANDTYLALPTFLTQVPDALIENDTNELKVSVYDSSNQMTEDQYLSYTYDESKDTVTVYISNESGVIEPNPLVIKNPQGTIFLRLSLGLKEGGNIVVTTIDIDPGRGIPS